MYIYSDSRLALNRGSRLDFTPRPTLFSSLLASAVSSHLSIEETPSARLSKLENYGFDQLVSQPEIRMDKENELRFAAVRPKVTTI